MTPEQIQYLIDRIESIGGTLATAGFELAVRQVIIESTAWLVFSTVCVIADVIALRYWLRFINRKDSDGNYAENEGDRDGGTVMGCIVATLVSIIPAFNIVFNIVQLLNPQWYAVKYLFSLVGGQ